MFAGVGPIAVVAGKKVKYVYANDLNPTAVAYMQHNVSLNKLGNRVEVLVLCTIYLPYASHALSSPSACSEFNYTNRLITSQ